MLCPVMPRDVMHSNSCFALPPMGLNKLSNMKHTVANLLDLLLVGAAVNSPGGPLVFQPVSNLVKPLFQAVPVPPQPPQHPIKVLAGCLYLHLPVVQVTQARPNMSFKPFVCRCLDA